MIMIVLLNDSATAIYKEGIIANPINLEIKKPIIDVNKTCPMPVIKETFPTSTSLAGGNQALKFPEVNDKLAKLKKIARYANSLGVPGEILIPHFTLSRGLDYYTGAIFETVVTKPKIGSVTGGGRYDNLINRLGGPAWPAVGTTIGLDRICDVIVENNLWPEIQAGNTKVLVAVSNSHKTEPLLITNLLRKRDINTEIYLNTAPLSNQLKYADKKGIPYALIIDEEERETGQIAIKDLNKRTQSSVNLDVFKKDPKKYLPGT